MMEIATPVCELARNDVIFVVRNDRFSCIVGFTYLLLTFADVPLVGLGLILALA